MEKIKLPPDASRTLNIRFDKNDYNFILDQYNSDPAFYRSLAGVIKEGLHLLKFRKPLKSKSTKGGTIWI